MTAREVLALYQGRLRDLQAALEQVRLHGSLATIALAIAVALFLTLSFYAVRQHAGLWWLAVTVPFVAASARLYGLNRRSGNRLGRLERFYRRASERIQGNWARSGAAGDEFSDSTHVYSSDLNVFGEGSLFELLCTVRTANGKRGLAEYLRKAPALEETLRRQEAVRELRERVDLQERMALLGEFEFQESKWETFAGWLDAPPFSFSRVVQIVAFISSLLLAVIVLAGLAGLIAWTTIGIWMIPLVGFHSVIGLIFGSELTGWLVGIILSPLKRRS